MTGGAPAFEGCGVGVGETNAVGDALGRWRLIPSRFWNERKREQHENVEEKKTTERQHDSPAHIETYR